ncbi:uncharacterized protein LOC132737377 [Ruditapes philippinarum]|uniref:uncharacterized protein LOC132737377 n=1 Tax=Ruditapes philippinarum TaxID=129788 RepID=UPI00295B1CC1|nr:uncharacterized protein LOC132737377 [Ruditapes philippinarum]
MAAVTTRSKTRHQHENGVSSAHVTKNVRKNEVTPQSYDVISNSFNSYKESYETIGNSEVGQKIRHFLNKLFFPVCLVSTTPLIVFICWYTNIHCNGSYTEMFTRLRNGSVYFNLLEILRSISIINSFTVGVVFGYFAWAVFWMRVLPGKSVTGPVTPNGNVPVYIDNGFLHYIITMLGFCVLTIGLKMYGMTPTVVYDRFGELLAFMICFALVFVLILYFKGVFAPSSTDSGRTDGGFIFDYYWGTELYPRIFGVDVKVFTNCRFGMTVWPLLVCIYALKSYELYGFVDSMFVTTVLQLAYITKFFRWEAGYMQTIDIILDRAGFYICWGCLCWVPAIYPLVSQYLVSHPVRLGPLWASVILCLGLVSVLVNYHADLQRQVVRKADGNCLIWGKRPDIIRAKYTIESGEERESILLASGWWGLSRHFHYIPEILLSFFWTLPTGFVHMLPYTYVIVLVFLLTHRSFRDENKCSRKYGKYWQKYCAKVKHRIVPFLF